ncbi:hypothetical protein [Klebsiella quasipneumoniae]|uniref:hypothetical protein n=1 Tax=Klebsiella quasipneumoniae TaxID=1463165 RepID=UPI003F6E0EC6
MNIKQQLNDAVFLMENGRYDSALSLVLCAIDASSALMFPKGTKSHFAPNDKMRNNERFRLCIGYGLRRALSRVEPEASDFGKSKFTIEYGGRGAVPLENILYHDYRCGMVHEGELPAHVDFSDLSGDPSVSDINGFRMKIENDVLFLDYKSLDFLINVVKDLPVNGGPQLPKAKKPLKLKFRPEVNQQDLLSEIRREYFLKESKVGHISEFFSFNGNHDRDFTILSDEQIQGEFQLAVENHDVNPAIFRSLSRMYDPESNALRPSIFSEGNTLNASGIKLIKLLSQKYEEDN